MTIIDYFFDLGPLIFTALGLGVFLGSLVKHFTDLRIILPRLFDEYKQDELSENLTKLDKSLETGARRIFFSGFFLALGFLLIVFYK